MIQIYPGIWTNDVDPTMFKISLVMTAVIITFVSILFYINRKK